MEKKSLMPKLTVFPLIVIFFSESLVIKPMSCITCSVSILPIYMLFATVILCLCLQCYLL